MNITAIFKTEFIGGHSICRGPLFLGHAVYEKKIICCWPTNCANFKIDHSQETNFYFWFKIQSSSMFKKRVLGWVYLWFWTCISSSNLIASQMKIPGGGGTCTLIQAEYHSHKRTFKAHFEHTFCRYANWPYKCIFACFFPSFPLTACDHDQKHTIFSNFAWSW